MFLKTLLVSIFILFFSTSVSAQAPMMTAIQVTHACYPTESLLETWKENGELISYIANVTGTPTNPPGQAIVTINKENKAYTIIYSMQIENQQVSCLVLHGDNFIKVN